MESCGTGPLSSPPQGHEVKKARLPAAAGWLSTKEPTACALLPWPQPAREESANDKGSHHAPGMPAAEMTRSSEIFHLPSNQTHLKILSSYYSVDTVLIQSELLQRRIGLSSSPHRNCHFTKSLPPQYPAIISNEKVDPHPIGVLHARLNADLGDPSHW